MHVHCFNDNWSVCERWLRDYPGCMVGLTPLVCKPAVTHVHDVARRIPLDRLLLETDAPYFLPDKVRQIST